MANRLAAALLESCDDSALFGIELWPRQRELLAAVEEGTRLHVWRLGRRSGKSTLGGLIALWDCLLRPQLDALVRPGEKRYAVAIATSREQATVVVDAARAIVESSPLLAPLLVSSTDDELEFVNRTVFRALPATARGIRGLPISSLVFDEAAHMLDSDSNPSAGSLFRSLIPATFQFGHHARVIVSSTPLDAGSWFAQLVERVEAGEIDSARAWHFSTPQMNPTIDPALLEQEHGRDADAYRAEVLAEFVTGGGAFLDPQRVDEAVGSHAELGRLDCVEWVLGVDLAFSRDPAAAVLVGREPTNPEQLRVGLVRVWEPERAATFEDKRGVEDRLLEEVADLATYFGAKIVIDQLLAPQVEARLSRRGVHVEVLHLNAESKTLCFTELRARINDRSLELLPDERLLRELKGLRSSFVPGRARVLTPRISRGHSDVAVACALATYAMRSSGATALQASSGWEASPDSLDDLLSGGSGITADMPF